MSINGIGMIDPVLQFEDGNGVPYAGGSVTFYAVSTVNLLDVYSDPALTVTLLNPVSLNAAGRSSTSTSGPDTGVYLGQANYDYVLKDASGTVIYGPISFAGSQWPGQVQGQATTNPAANANSFANRFTTTLNKASSGTHALFAGTRFDIPTIGAGASTLTEADTVYIEGAPATGTNVYALHVDNGNVLFDGNLSVGGTFNLVDISTNQFRLSASTGVAVATTDVTAAVTIFAVPYKGNQISLYNASGVSMLYTSAQFSIAVPNAASTVYDVFCFANGTVPTLELTAWTNDTTRATAIVNNVAVGIYTKSGDATRRYLGTFRTTTVSGQTEDSFTKRYVWNYYNQVPRPLKWLETTNSWNYTLATYRQANNSTANQVDTVVGIAETPVDIAVYATASNGSTAGAAVSIGINGLTPSTTQPTVLNTANSISNTFVAKLLVVPAIGRSYYAWLEISQANGTTQWTSNASGISSAYANQSGIIGSLLG